MFLFFPLQVCTVCLHKILIETLREPLMDSYIRSFPTLSGLSLVGPQVLCYLGYVLSFPLKSPTTICFEGPLAICLRVPSCPDPTLVSVSEVLPPGSPILTLLTLLPKICKLFHVLFTNVKSTSRPLLN